MAGQTHGLRAEGMVRAAKYPETLGVYQNPTNAVFDIDKVHKKKGALPVSIKTTGSNTIWLADARAFVDVDRMLQRNGLPGYILEIVTWQQVGRFKVFHKATTFHISDEIQRAIVGDVTVDEVAHIHNGISKRWFAADEPAAARAWAKREIALLKPKLGILKLNPKIDHSGKERRLQCSVSMSGLKELINRFDHWMPGMVRNHASTTVACGSLGLPFRLVSPQRKI